MEDPHNMYPWFGSIFVFPGLGSVLVLAVICGGSKLMNYLETRRAEKENETRSKEKIQNATRIIRKEIRSLDYRNKQIGRSMGQEDPTVCQTEETLPVTNQ